jgi:hypothetical protein
MNKKTREEQVEHKQKIEILEFAVQTGDSVKD